MQHSTGGNSTRFADWLVSQWGRVTPWQLILLPIAALFYLLVQLRIGFYRLGLMERSRMPVPVIVVGNLNVGGTGKTPLVLWLVAFLRSHGFQPGIISRGYGSRASSPQSVTATSDPVLVGDEPVLLAQRAQCPVWVGVKRAQVARALLSARPDCDVLISDDGLQHYALERDVEIVVVDGVYRFGNGWVLPAGPLREPMERLNSVDAVVVNGGEAGVGEYAMSLVSGVFRQVRQPVQAEAGDFFGKRLHAVAGIGRPDRFFATLRQLGLQVVEHPFPDHHIYEPQELQFDQAEAVLMTEKDAVKCAAFAPPNAWYLAVDAEIAPDFGVKVLELLRKAHGCKTA